MHLTTLIRGGMVLDGTGREGEIADVGIAGDRIEAVAPRLAAEADAVVDATGLVVSPGFIDIHAHGDLYALMAPGAPARLHDGVTIEVLGNCGESPFPQSGEMLAERADSAERNGVAVEWATLDDYARRHDEVGTGINRASLVGHGNVRRAVMGEADRAPTPDELDAMRREVEAAMEAGAFGMSTGLIYAPCMYAEPAEIEALCEVVARHGGLYASHIRGEGDSLERSLEEFVGAGRRTGVRLEHSHAKVSGRGNWGKADRVIAWIEGVRAEGIDLACDRYPYIASSTSLSSLLPGWAREGGREPMLERIDTPADRERILGEVNGANTDWARWQAIQVANAACDAWRHAEGRSLSDLADEHGREPAELVLDLLAASDGRASMVAFSMCEENLEKWLRLPFVAIGSDSSSRSADGPTSVGKPHPRSFGTSARFLGRYVRERRVVELPDAVRRLTGLPASRLGLKLRGVLRPGAYADVTVFDPDTIADRATYQEPQQYSAGVQWVFVNGKAAIADGELTGVRNGCFIRRGAE